MDNRINWENLYQQCKAELAKLKQFAHLPVLMAEKSTSVCYKYMEKLKSEVGKTGFLSNREEIDFFKNVKPRFQSLFLFHRKIYSIEAKRPIGSRQIQEAYLNSYLDDLKFFFSEHVELYEYFRSGATFLDDLYFLRNYSGELLTYDPRMVDKDPVFTTLKDYTIAEILANDLIASYLEDALLQLRNPILSQPSFASVAEESGLVWTNSKTDFVEFVYAIKANGALNNGKASLNFIFSKLGKMLGIEISNSSRTFQEILSRSQTHRSFIKTLDTDYTQYINNIGE